MGTGPLGVRGVRRVRSPVWARPSLGSLRSIVRGRLFPTQVRSRPVPRAAAGGRTGRKNRTHTGPILPPPPLGPVNATGRAF